MIKLTPTEPVLTSKPDGDTKIPDPKKGIVSKREIGKVHERVIKIKLDEITSYFKKLF
jgi:hypothetical protein